MISEQQALDLDQADELAAFRQRFTIPTDTIYLDGNSLGLMSRDAERAVRRVLEQWKHQAIGGYSQPRPEPHPVAAFVLANRGIGISLADLFALFGSDINDGPLLAESSIELHRPLAADTDYEVRGEIESVERRRSRRIGPFDRITCRFDLFQAGDLAATVTNVFAVPRPESAS